MFNNDSKNSKKNIGKILCIAFVMMLIMIVMTGCRTSTAGYNYESARLQYKQQNYDKALEFINQAVSVSQKSEYFLFQGDILYELKKYEEAIEAYTKGITKNTDTISLENSKQAYTKLAITYIDTAKYDLANSNIDNALKINVLEKMNKEILLYKMDVLLYLKKYKEVCDCANEYVKKYTKSKDAARAYIKMARAYSEEQNYDKAMENYDKAIKFDNSAYYYRAGTYEAMGEYKKSYNDYESFLKVSKADIKYSIYTKQLDCLFKWIEKSADKEAYEKAEKVVSAGMASQDEENIKLFGKKYIALLEREGKYEDAYVYASEYAAEYPSDETIKKEIKFLETRILPSSN